jgi:hypothetical protein
MEPSGRSQWEPVANAEAPKTAETSHNRCHYREGVEPVSPENGDRRIRLLIRDSNQRVWSVYGA